MSRFGPAKPLDQQGQTQPPTASRFGPAKIVQQPQQPQQPGVPANFIPPTAGGQVDQRMLDLAARMPETQFDFTDYNQTDAVGGRQQLPSLTPQQQTEQTEFERLVNRVTPVVNDPTNPVGRAADQLLIEDANVTPIEQAGGYQQRGAQLKQEALERTPRAVRPVATGFLQSGLTTGALLGQVTDAIGATKGAADLMNRETAELSENRQALGTTMFEDAAEGVTRSITDLFTLGGPTFLAGPNAGALAARMTQALPAISAFTAKAMNDAEYRGSQAGLEGGDLAQYVLTQGAIEGMTTTAFSMVGLGGFENLKQGAKAGVREALKSFGIQTISELTEENLIGVMSAITDATSGVDPEATSPERMKELIAETTLATLMTMGLAEGTQRALAASRGQQQNRDAKTPVETESRGTRDFGPVQGPQQLALPTGLDIAERKAGDARAALGEAQGKLAAERAALAQQPAGDGPIAVDPQGKATTPTQQADIDQLTQSITTPQLDPSRLLPGQQARFVAEPDTPARVDVKGLDSAEAVTKLRQQGPVIPTGHTKTLGPGRHRVKASDLTASSVNTDVQIGAERVDHWKRMPHRTKVPLQVTERADGMLEVMDGNHRLVASLIQGDQEIDIVVLDSEVGAGKAISRPTTIRDNQPSQVSPQAEESVRRSESTTDAVTEEADSIIKDMRKRTDVSEADEARIRELVNEARRNPLTGGMNRNAFSKVFDAVRTRARKSGKPMSLIAIDAKNLKIYNDNISESAGDEYLRRAQKVLENALRGSDAGRDRIGDAFHYGGDEWAIILPDTDTKGAELVRDRIEQAFGSTEIVPGVSDGLVGGVVEVNPNSRKKMRSFLDDAVKEMKARKTEQKRAAGEATTREEAEARAAQATTPPPAPVFKRASAGVRDAAAAVGRAKREVERTQAVVERIKAEQELNANEPGSFDPNDPDAVAEALTPPGTPRVAKQSIAREMLSKTITPMGYTVERWAPRLYARVKQFERHWRSDRNDADKLVYQLEKFFKGRNNAPIRERFLYLLQTQRSDEARQYLREQMPEQAAQVMEVLDTVRTAKDNWYSQWQEASGKGGLVHDHMPRYPKAETFDEFMEERHGPEATDELMVAIRTAERKKGRPLTLPEKIEVSNKLLINGRPPTRPGTTSPRKFGERTVEDLDFETWKRYYDTTFDTLYNYFDTVVYNTHKARLFGKDTADADIDETIGRMFVEGKYGLNNLTAYQKNRMRSILTARFTAGEQGTGGVSRTLRDLGYGTILADPIATVIQFADVMQTGVRDGVLPTLAAIPAAVREQFLTSKNLGLDHISDTYGDVNWLSKLLRKGLTISGFRLVDNGFLTVGLVSAKRTAQKKLRTAKGEQRFRQQWQRYYDPAALDTLVADLKANKPSDMVADFAYMRASETRPMDHFDAPEAYVANPKLRILWQMKQFAIKQFSLVRRQGWDKVAKGIRTNNPRLAAEGTAGLMRAMMLLGLAGAGADWLRDWLWDRNPDFEDSFVNSLLYTHLGSTYLFNNAAQDGPGNAAWNMVAPPVFSQVDDVWKSAVDDKQKWWRVLPVVGDTVYSFTSENAEKNVKNMRQEALDNARESHLRGDISGRNTYIKMFNNRMKDLGRKDRLSVMSVTRSAKRKEETAKEEGASPWGTTRTWP